MTATIKDIIPVKGCNRIKVHHSVNAKIDSIGTDDLVIDGPAFIWSSRGLGFYHVFVDMLNDWLICKETIPDIKLYIFSPAPNSMDIIDEMQPFYSELLDMLPIEANIIETEYKTITFRDLYFCSNEMNFAINDKLFPNDKIGTTGGHMNPRFYEWHSLAFKNLKDFFKDYIYTGEPHLKIYVSRKAEHSKIKSFYDLIDQDQKDSTVQKTMLGEDQYLERSLYRYFDPEEEEKLEKFFADHGYSVIDFSDMSLLEQIIVSSSAKVMAGFHGAGMLNAAYMQKDTTVMLLNTCNVNTFYHTELHRIDKHRVYEFPPRGTMPAKTGVYVPFKELCIDAVKQYGKDLVSQYTADDIINYIINNDYLVAVL